MMKARQGKLRLKRGVDAEEGASGRRHDIRVTFTDPGTGRGRAAGSDIDAYRTYLARRSTRPLYAMKRLRLAVR